MQQKLLSFHLNPTVDVSFGSGGFQAIYRHATNRALLDNFSHQTIFPVNERSWTFKSLSYINTMMCSAFSHIKLFCQPEPATSLLSSFIFFLSLPS